jgi:hypothetical protein
MFEAHYLRPHRFASRAGKPGTRSAEVHCALVTRGLLFTRVCLKPRSAAPRGVPLLPTCARLGLRKEETNPCGAIYV